MIASSTPTCDVITNERGQEGLLCNQHIQASTHMPKRRMAAFNQTSAAGGGAGDDAAGRGCARRMAVLKRTSETSERSSRRSGWGCYRQGMCSKTPKEHHAISVTSTRHSASFMLARALRMTSRIRYASCVTPRASSSPSSFSRTPENALPKVLGAAAAAAACHALTAPNSFSMTANFMPCVVSFKIWFSKVVLPEPDDGAVEERAERASEGEREQRVRQHAPSNEKRPAVLCWKKEQRGIRAQMLKIS